MSTVCLSECVKQTSQKTAKKILTEYIIMEAHFKLLNTQFSVETIATELGFDDRSNFINFYKKHTRLTPNQERKSNLPVRV
ncbi:AraC family transcriptional regulator [bacterium SCSIO 12741]|nr:AraC family transcriptional regulator [bacterium SCSIO 12741]